MTENNSLTQRQSPMAVFLAFLKLGFTSFGGPVAHLGYFREDFVERRKWLDDKSYADLVALCQFLPGPASSQVGIGIGLSKAGLPGAFAAWIAFTTPSAVAMALIGYGVIGLGESLPMGLLLGLKAVAVAVVAQAVWGMSRSLCPDKERLTLALLACIGLLFAPSPLFQVLVIVAGGVIGFFLFKPEADSRETRFNVPVSKQIALSCLALFFLLLAGLPVLAAIYPSQALALVDAFYRAGSLVFGGGHVVLPLLQSEVVPTGMMSDSTFLAGYGAAQAMPGPLFTFAAYLGAVMNEVPNGWLGALICVVAIFLSSFLLVIGALPFWDGLRRRETVQRALMGVNAAVVGLLLAALYTPVWTSGVTSPATFALMLLAAILLMVWKLPPWLVVVIGALAGWGLYGLVL